MILGSIYNVSSLFETRLKSRGPYLKGTSHQGRQVSFLHSMDIFYGCGMFWLLNDTLEE